MDSKSVRTTYKIHTLSVYLNTLDPLAVETDDVYVSKSFQKYVFRMV